MSRDELPTYADLIVPRGEPRTAYQAVAYAADGSVTRGKLHLTKRGGVDEALGLELAGKGRTIVADVQIIDRGITAGASDAGDQRKDPTVANQSKRKAATKGERRAAARNTKPKAKPTRKKNAQPAPKPSTNGHAAALDLAALKGGSKLVATFKGKRHEATIITGASAGHSPAVLYRGVTYKTLSGAARAVLEHANGADTKARTNGRTFWRPA